MLAPSKSNFIPVSVYGSTFRSSWEKIDAIHAKTEGEQFKPNCHDMAVTAIRSTLFEALDRPLSPLDHNAALADFAKTAFLAHAVDAIVYAPLLTAETEDFSHWHRTFAMQLHYAATQALSTLIKNDTLRDTSSRFRPNALGTANEIVPIGLVNRLETTRPSGLLMLPGSYIEDTREATDLKLVYLMPSPSVERIQVKTTGRSGRRPEGGTIIQAYDFDNKNAFIPYALVNESRRPVTQAVKNHLNAATTQLIGQLRRRFEPHPQSVARPTQSTDPKRPLYAKPIKNKVGVLHPELGALRDQLLFGSLDATD